MTAGKDLIPFSSVPAVPEKPAQGPAWDALRRATPTGDWGPLGWATIVEGQISAVNVTNGGAGYASPPIVEISPVEPEQFFLNNNLTDPNN